MKEKLYVKKAYVIHMNIFSSKNESVVLIYLKII